jgi:octaprenyl-diphosphate synthase
MRILASTTNAIAEGEVLQLLNAHSPDTSEQAYFDTIHRKTAKLFEAAAWLGGVVGAQSEQVCRALANYGIHLGTAFQLVDDVMDYVSDSVQMGKDAGDDLAEGKPTLPLIYAMRRGSEDQRYVVRSAIQNGDRDRIQDVLEIVQQTGALDYTLAQAQEQSDLAEKEIDCLPDSKYRTALKNLARYAVLRNR